MTDRELIKEFRESLDEAKEMVIRIDSNVGTIKDNYVSKEGMELAITGAVVTHERHRHKAISWALIGQILVMVGMIVAAVLGLK